MKLEPFLLERWQSEWENTVAHNLSESGVHPLSLRELLGQGESSELERLREQLLDQRLGYVQTNGTPELRAAVAALYPGASAENVVVTNGTAEANFIAAWRLVEPGDEVVMVLPNYMQLWGAFRSFGVEVKGVSLNEKAGWALDPDVLERAVSARTRLIVVCNPNNPTGAVLSEDAVTAILRAAGRHGAWVLCDEVYRGAERVGPETATLWGRYDRLLVACGLSKAYGLPGLRIGWLVSPVAEASELWARKDYLTIAPGALSDFLARRALARRDWLLERTRGILRTNYPVLESWLSAHGSAFRIVPPRAGAIAFVGYSFGMGSTELVEHLREEQSVLIVPGDHFGMDGYLRLGFGNEPADLAGGLARLDAFLTARVR